nr:unnamed protein product [Callosobruchus analis]
MSYQCFVGVMVVAVVTLAEAAKLPTDWGRCHRTDPSLEICLRENIEEAIHKLKNGNVDFNEKKLYARSITPSLRLQGHYTMAGKVLLLPIVGDGECNITLNYTITLTPEKMTYQFDNLFDGDQALGDNINKVLNENWSEVFEDVREGYEKGIGAIFHNLGNRVFSVVPLDEIYLL